eukprot:4040225-Alexandrium_andersonii.AAC.1
MSVWPAHDRRMRCSARAVHLSGVQQSCFQGEARACCAGEPRLATASVDGQVLGWWWRRTLV